MKPVAEITDPRIIKALGHPLRIQILNLLDAAESSPVEISQKLGASLGTVSYHVRQLAELGLIELTRTTPRRGAVEHHYKRGELVDLETGDWSSLPSVARRGAAAASLQTAGDFVQAAATGSGFEGAESRVEAVQVELDVQGRKELAREVDALAKRARAIERESRKRIKAGAQSTPSALVVLHFEPAAEHADGDAGP